MLIREYAMTEKLIIENKTDLPMDEILLMAFSVIRTGRASGNIYKSCYEFENNAICSVTKTRSRTH